MSSILKTITRKSKSSEFVNESLRTHQDRLARAMGDEYGEEMASLVRRMSELMSARLFSVTRVMLESDERHAAEMADDNSVRRERDEAVGELYTQIGQLRSGVEVVYGRAGVKVLGLDMDTPREAVALRRMAVFAVQQLPALASMPARSVPGLSFDFDTFAQPFRQAATRLESAFAAVVREDKENDASLVERNRATDIYDRVFTRTATLTSALFSVAGEDELARKVRPTGRRPGTAAFIDEESPEPVTEAPALVEAV